MKKKKKAALPNAMIWREGRWVVLSVKEIPVRKGDLLRFRGLRTIVSIAKDSTQDRKGNWILDAEDFGILSK